MKALLQIGHDLAAALDAACNANPTPVENLVREMEASRRRALRRKAYARRSLRRQLIRSMEQSS